MAGVIDAIAGAVKGGLGIGEEEEKGEPKRFDAQCFLMDFYKSFTKANVAVTYGNFIKINVDPTQAISQLLNKKKSFPLNEFTPAQMSCLVPKFRLYKLYPKAGSPRKHSEPRKEFHFEDFTNLNKPSYTDKYEEFNINPTNKTIAVGFKSFSWEDLGQNPANQGLTFKASLAITCPNMQSLFRKGPNGLSFDEIICPAHRKKTEETPEYVNADNRFQAELGWVVPSSFTTAPEIWGDKKQRERLQGAVQEAQISLFLNLQSHEIDIKEDGAIELTVEFMASLEAGLFSPASDLFYPGKDRLQMTKNREELIKKLQKGVTSLEAQKITFEKQGLQDDAWLKFDDPEMNYINQQIEDQQSEIKKQKQIIKDHEESWMMEKWSSLLTRIAEKRRFFKLEFTDKELKAYQALNALYLNPDLSAEELQRARRTLVQQFRLFNQNYRPTPTGVPSSLVTLQSEIGHAAGKYHSHDGLNDTGFGALDKAGDVVYGWMNDTRAEQTADAAENSMKPVLNASDPNNKTINYFYMGDLLESAFGIVRRNQTADHESHEDLWRFMVGNIQIYDWEEQRHRNVNVADLPICWEYFQQFFIEKVLKQNKRKWNIRVFLKDVISELVVGALGPDCYGKMTPTARTRINTQVLPLPSNGHWHNPIPDGGKALSNTFDLVKWSNPKRWRNYLFVYAAGGMNHEWKGDYDKDQANNILHLQIGADRGLLKTVSFSKQDMPGQREANMKKTIDEGGQIDNLLFSNKYNADLTLFGNTLFNVGTTIYLDPTGLGIGSLSNVGSMAQKLGIGGYYFIVKVENKIESGKFETTLSTKLQGLGNSKEKAPAGSIEAMETCHTRDDCAEGTFNPSEPRISEPPPRYGAGRTRHWKSFPD